MVSKLGNSSGELPRSHQLLSISADCTVAGTAFYAASVYLLQIPLQVAVVIAAASTVLVWLVLARLVLHNSFRPKTGTFLRASVGTVASVTVAVGFFAVFTLRTASVSAAYLPMIATVCGAMLLRSAARNMATK